MPVSACVRAFIGEAGDVVAPASLTGGWEPLYASGTLGNFDVGREAFNEAFRSAENQMLLRKCFVSAPSPRVERAERPGALYACNRRAGGGFRPNPYP